MNERFEKQLKFIYEIDKIKQIVRRTKLFDNSRFENDAEHSWHLAMMAMVLHEYSNETVDLSRVIMTTRLAGGLLYPYKGLLPAALVSASNDSPTAESFRADPKGSLFYLRLFAGSPVNGSMYSFILI